MVRLKEIAILAQCSVMTVSKALRDKPDVSPATKARIKSLAKQLGYVPDSSAKMLRTRASKLFGVVISSFANPIYSQVACALEERAFSLGYDILMGCTLNDSEREESVIRRMLARGVEGLFVAPVYRLGSEARIYQELARQGLPTVLLGHPAPFCSSFTSVACDDLRAGNLVTRHLLQLGHRRIAFLCGPPGSPWSTHRLDGYRSALREAGIDVDDNLVFQAGRTIEEGREAARQLLAEKPELTAVQAVNDFVAIGCAEVLAGVGLAIPSAFSLTGFGNTLVGEHSQVPLTTTDQPKKRLGHTAMDSLLKLLGGAHAESKRIYPELIIRQSSGIAPATAVLGRR